MTRSTLNRASRLSGSRVYIGPELMAVTSDMTLHFLNKGAPGDLIAEARLLKLGRRLAVMDVMVSSGADAQTVIAHVSGSYALPQAKK